MIEHPMEAPAGDLEDLVALIELADEAAIELAKLEAERLRLHDAFQLASVELTKQLDADALPIADLSTLARIAGALADIEAAIEAAIDALLMRLPASEPRHPIRV